MSDEVDVRGESPIEKLTIGRALGERRRVLGMDQKSAAVAIGVSYSTYAGYERGTRRPSIDVLRALADHLNVQIDKILELYGATCVEQARLALLRETSTSTAPAAKRSSAGLRRVSRSDDMSVVKRVYFDVEVDPEYSNVRSFVTVSPENADTERVAEPIAQVIKEDELTPKDQAKTKKLRSGTKKKGKKKDKKKDKKKNRKKGLKNREEARSDDSKKRRTKGKRKKRR